VSLNLLEVAKAFGAPLLDGVNSNAGRQQLAREAGRKRLKYGAVVVAAGAAEAGSHERAADQLLLCLEIQAGDTGDGNEQGGRRVLTPPPEATFV
jgi:hypothetical protein